MSTPKPGTHAILRKDALTGRKWLEFPDKPAQKVIDALKAHGWRWSSYRKAWHNPRIYASLPTWLGVEVTDGGTVRYSEERADRLEERATKHATAAASAHARVDAIASMIPFGQPVLVGHHSEGRHRRDLGRIESGMRTSIAENTAAERLHAAAESSRAHQAHKQSAGAMARRLDKLDADLNHRLRVQANWLSDGSPRDDVLQQYIERTQELQAERDQLAMELAAMGGTKAEQLEVRPGDTIRIKGNVCLVRKVNRKTYGVVISAGPCKGWTFNYDKSWLQAVIRRAGEPAAE